MTTESEASREELNEGQVLIKRFADAFQVASREVMNSIEFSDTAALAHVMASLAEAIDGMVASVLTARYNQDEMHDGLRDLINDEQEMAQIRTTLGKMLKAVWRDKFG